MDPQAEALKEVLDILPVVFDEATEQTIDEMMQDDGGEA